MELIKVTIKNFLSIKNEETIKINNTITTIIGLNESGKTTLLKAIEKLNGLKIEKNEKNKSCKTEESYIKGVFILSKEEIIKINENSGKNLVVFPEMDLYLEVYINDKTNDRSYVLKEKIDNKTTKEINMNLIIFTNFIEYLNKLARDFKLKSEDEIFIKIKEFEEMNIDEIKQEFPPFIEEYVANEIYDSLSKMKDELNVSWTDLVPDFKIVKFSSSSDLVSDEVSIDFIKENIQVSNLLKISNIGVEELIKSVDSDDNEELTTYEGDFKEVVTERFKEIFRKNDKDFSFIIKIDTKNKKILFFTKDKTTGNSPIPLKNRSDGFKWYFSIYITLYEYLERLDDTKYILLFDEPNLYLNPTAQYDLIERVFKSEFKKEQIIYTTHSPYMIDSTNFSSIRIVEKVKQTKFYNTTVDYFKEHKSISKNEVDPLTPILTALNIDISNSLIMNRNRKIIIVEGIEDIYILNAMAKKLKIVKQLENISFVPCFGASKTPTMFGYLYGLGYDVFTLLDNDDDGKNAIKEILGEEADKSVLFNKMMTYNLHSDKEKEVKLEDLFSDETRIEHLTPKNTVVYRNFSDDIDEIKINKTTIESFKKLFDYIINVIKGE